MIVYRLFLVSFCLVLTSCSGEGQLCNRVKVSAANEVHLQRLWETLTTIQVNLDQYEVYFGYDGSLEVGDRHVPNSENAQITHVIDWASLGFANSNNQIYLFPLSDRSSEGVEELKTDIKQRGFSKAILGNINIQLKIVPSDQPSRAYRAEVICRRTNS